MTQKEKLIELIGKAIISARDNYGMPFSQDVADYLMAHGCIVFDEDKIDRRNLPLISTCVGRPINEVLKLIRAEENGDIIRLPFKIGDKVYAAGNQTIKKFDVSSIIINSCGVYVTDNIFGSPYPARLIYKTIEEAEAALEK